MTPDTHVWFETRFCSRCGAPTEHEITMDDFQTGMDPRVTERGYWGECLAEGCGHGHRLDIEAEWEVYS